jgi:acetyltransferase (GNAT) family protein
MSARVRPARREDRAAVVELLHTRMNPRIARERWALLFDYPWRPADAPDFGRVLERGGEIVGYLGATYVDRVIGGERLRLCNMSSWYLMREHRGQGHGRSMVLDLACDPDMTYTDVTATPQVHGMLLAHAGFAVLDAERWILRPDRGRAGGAVLGEAADSPELRHHRGMKDVRFLRAGIAGEECTLAVQVKKMGEDVAYHQVLYADAPEVLGRHAGAIANALLPEGPAVLAIDRRLVPARPADAACEAIPQPRLFKSRRLGRERIDNLYTEVLLLDQKLP